MDTHLPGPTGSLSFHRNSHATHYVSDPGGGSFRTRTNSVFLLTGVDVAEPSGPTVAVLGDSIAEGVGTPTTPTSAGRTSSRTVCAAPPSPTWASAATGCC